MHACISDGQKGLSMRKIPCRLTFPLAKELREASEEILASMGELNVVQRITVYQQWIHRITLYQKSSSSSVVRNRPLHRSTGHSRRKRRRRRRNRTRILQPEEEEEEEEELSQQT